MRWLIASAVALLLSAQWDAAKASGTDGITLGAHAYTWHDQPGYRSSTPGLYLRLATGATVGALRNSEGHGSVYAGWTWTTDEQRPVSAAITAGGITGYALAPVVPLVVPSVRVALTQRLALRAILLPRFHPKQGATAVNVALEWRL